ncbi:DNA polymerase theta-like [Chrysoperla carnea]|uniref:DNA polymerase theta-like n=1 Tax=Chrysoperla carnea TaxID=189513 RepID=UPI001D065724|nr:DNA polymerase theta-like [Chrysoperla carnea]
MNSSKESLDNSINDINFSQEIFKRLRRSKKRKSSNCVLTKCRNIGLSKKNGISNETRSKTSQKTHSNIIHDNSNASSSIVSTQQLQKLESWGLPPGVLAKYEERGIKEMFPWQVECLSNIKILNEHANLVYSAPTSAGKTLVAEILAIKTVLERQRKVLIILPFVSVVREKMFYFQDIFRSNGVRVEGFMGSYNPPGGFSKVQVAICTIEKANNIVNRLLEDNNIEEIGAVVIDELHLLGDPSRGYLLELLLTKLLYISKKKPEFKIQIIGMSATLPNLSSLSTWLNAELFKTDFRPIPLLEQCYMNGVLYDSKIAVIRKIEPHPDIPKDMDNIIQFCLETIYCSCSVLIFCSAKNWCETLAQQISSTFRQLGRSESPLGVCLREQLKTNSIIEVLEQLKRCPVGLDTILKITVSFGVAFHHAGLTIDERDIIEGGFRNGAIRVLVATSTLSAGVNLPARRVIIRSPMFGGKPMDTLTYRQMIGRAGRMGKDTAGESILICQKNEKYAAEQLLSGNLKPISSCLEGSGRLKRAILEVIASGVAISPNDVKLFTECTLLASSEIFDEIENPIEETVHFLLRNEFIRLQKSETNQMQYVATSLAKACLSSAMPPEEGLTLFAELEKARQCFVLESELHIIYLVTPYSACNQWGTIDWMFYQSLWDELSQADQRVGELIGISESYIARAMSGRINNSKSQHRLHIHRRFYVALALRELVEEVPLATVAEKYKCNRGLLQSLQQSASTFAGMVTAFSKQLGWSSVELLVSQFQDRLQFGVSRELLDLARMPSLNGICARLLFNAGIETIVILASTDVCTLENILTRALPFERENDGETDYEKRKKLKTVWISGKNGLTEREAAEMLIIEARNFLKYEMGIAEAKWDTEVSSNSTQIETADTLDTSTKLYVSLNSITQASKNSTQNTSDNLNENVIDNSKSLTSKTFEVEKTLENMNENLNDNVIDNSDLSTSKTQEITPAIIDNSLPRTFVLEENKENHSELVQNSLPRTFVLENNEMKIINNICADENSKSTSSKTNQSVDTVLEKINETNTIENVQFNSKIFESDSTFDNICIAGHFSPRSNPEKGETKINESKLFGNDEIHSKMFESDSMFNNICVAENSKSTSSETNQNVNTILGRINESKTTENAQFNSNNISIAGNLESKTTTPRNKQSPTKSETKIIEYKPFENDKINSKMFESDSIFNNISAAENLVPKQTSQIDGAKLNESKPFENVEINSKMFESESMLDNICITEVSEQKSIPSGSIHGPNMSELQRSTENHEIIIRNFESESMSENVSTKEGKKVLESNSTPPVTKSNNSSFQTPDSFNDGIFDETPSVLNRVQLCAEEFAKASDYYVLENNFSSNIEFNISGMNLKTAKSYNWSTLDNAQLTDLENNKTVLNDTNKSGSLFDESILITSNICQILDNQIENQLKNNLDSKEELQVDENHLKNSFLEQAFDSFTISNNSKSLDDDIVLNSNDESMESPCFDRTGKSTSKLHENTKRKLLLINKTMKSVIVTNNKRVLKTINKDKKDQIETIKHNKDKIETVNSPMACEKFIKSKSEIGNRMIRYRSGLKNENSNTKKVNRFVINDRQVIGFSVYCEYNIVYFFSLSADAFVPENEILEFFQKLFLNKELTVYQFDAKEQIKLLLQLNFSIQCKYLDPKIIEWLFDPENRAQSFHNLIRNYSPELKDLAKSAGKSNYQESIALNIDSSISGKLRSATEALCTWHVIEAQQSKIIQQKWNMKKILDVEMGTIICLANMEVIGFGVNTEQLDQILSIVQEKMADIETECYSLVGRHFSLASSTEVAKVLKFAKTRTKVSTNKQVLEKLENPLAALIILWRKLNAILTKTLFPVLREINGSRIYCCSDSFNATGRITMYEPSLQSIPRDFEIPINDSILMLSVRSAFVPKDGYVLISADYCQLELRLLAYFSKDKRLCAIMHSDDDVFQLIAAKWNRIPIDEVDDVTRNRAKQLCYGIIYGMGVKTLSDQLEIDENQATEMIESFKNTYPKIRDFIEATIENCRKVGYVETLYGRRRYLEHINKSNSLKSQAERQAVNTTIQGSAADIAKTAMVRIHKTLQEQYDETENVANLVLHMHDELIYEAKITELNSVMVIIKHCMESAVHLSVPFPVKIKYGYSWGEMEVVDNVAEHRSR